MRVIIVGGGDVGYIAAETISDIHDVLVIEKDAVTAESVKSRLNVSVLHEDGTNPRTLKYAVETHNPSIIISTLHDDTSNLFVCMFCKSLYPDVTTIASITDPDYVVSTNKEAKTGIDVLISPEIIIAEKMYRLAVLENAIDYEFIGNLDLHLATFAVEKWHPIVGSIVMNIPHMDQCTVFGVYRDDILMMDVDTIEIHPGDRICALGTLKGLEALNETVGVEEVSREFTILGGSVVGQILARKLSEDPLKRYIKIIDKDGQRCVELSRNLNGVKVIQADYTEPEVQIQENVFKSDCTISTSRLDDTNLLMCMSAQKYNAHRIISRYFKKEYEDIFKFTGLESIIGYHKIVSNEITKYTVSDEMAIIRLHNQNELFFKHSVDQASKIKDCYLGDLRLPSRIRIVSVLRDGQFLFPQLDTRFVEGDTVIVFTDVAKQSELAKVFGNKVSSE